MNVALALDIADRRAPVDLSALDMDELEALASIPHNADRVRLHIDNLSDFAWQRLDRALAKVRVIEGFHHGR